MKLELHRISVGKLAFGAQTGVSGGVLTINKDELASLLLQDDRLSAVAKVSMKNRLKKLLDENPQG